MSVEGASSSSEAWLAGSEAWLAASISTEAAADAPHGGTSTPAPSSLGTTPTPHTGSTCTVIFCRSSAWGSSWGRPSWPEDCVRRLYRGCSDVSEGDRSGMEREVDDRVVAMEAVVASSKDGGVQGRRSGRPSSSSVG